MKRILSILLAVMMIASLLPVAAFAAADYTDTQGHPGKLAIDRWTGHGIVAGKGNGVFDPDGLLKRGEAAQIFANLFKLTEKADLSGFTDVGLGKWYDDAIAKCVKAGIMNGKGNGVMDPEGTLTREEFFVMFANALGIEPETTAETSVAGITQASGWAAGFIAALVNKGYVRDTAVARPKENINRAGIMALLDKAITNYVDTTEGVTVGGGLTLIVVDNANVSFETGTGNAEVYVFGDDVKITSAPAGTVVTTSDDATGTKVNGKAVSKDTTIVVGERKSSGSSNTPAEEYYTVSFDVQGHGAAPAAIKVTSGSAITTPAAVTAEGYTFGGWYKEAACINAWNFGTDTVTADMTLYAEWSESEDATYTVTFDMNGHGEPIIITGNTYGSMITSPAAVSAEGWVLVGWYKEAECTNEWDFYADTVTGDVTLYAKWEEAVPEPEITIADVLATVDGFPLLGVEEVEPASGAWSATLDEKQKYCYLTCEGDSLRFKYMDDYKNIDTNGAVSQDSDNYVYTDSAITITFAMSEGELSSITFADEATDTWDGTYEAPACIAAGTMISMPDGKQKAVEELEIGDVICTFDHETGEVSSAPVAFIWESKNAGNAFALTFEGGIELTVIEEHGFYDQEAQKYAFINIRNAEEYIGHHFYNADSNSWLELKSCAALNDRVDAYDIITSGHLNHLSNGMLSIGDGTEKMLANLFEYDDQMKFDEEKKKADIEAYGLTPKEKILEFDGFIEADYDTYNLQYINIAIGKGLTTWEQIKALSDYCVANGLF